MAKLDTCYAIIDAASEPAIFAMLDELDPPASCLYSEPIQPEIIELAPYLVEVNDEVRKWLSQRETPWGIYVYTQATMRELRQHLRKYLMVMIPDQEKPVFWRYYDPRIVWSMLYSFDNWRLHNFLGPITKVETELWGEHTEANFKYQRQGYPETVKKSGKLMKLTQSEYEAINDSFVYQFIRKLNYFFLEAKYGIESPYASFSLTKLVAEAFDRPPPNHEKIDRMYSEQSQQNSWALASALVSFCQTHDIHDRHSYMLLCYLLMTHRIYRFEDVPEAWTTFLIHSAGSGDYRVIRLVSNVVGQLPEFIEEGN